MYEVGDKIEVYDTRGEGEKVWVPCTVDSIDPNGPLTALSDEPQEWGEGRQTLYAVLKNDWSVLTRKPKET